MRTARNSVGDTRVGDFVVTLSDDHDRSPPEGQARVPRGNRVAKVKVECPRRPVALLIFGARGRDRVISAIRHFRADNSKKREQRQDFGGEVPNISIHIIFETRIKKSYFVQAERRTNSEIKIFHICRNNKWKCSRVRLRETM